VNATVMVVWFSHVRACRPPELTSSSGKHPPLGGRGLGTRLVQRATVSITVPSLYQPLLPPLPLSFLLHNFTSYISFTPTLSYSIIFFMRLGSPRTDFALAQSGRTLNRMQIASITVLTSSGGLLNTRTSAMSLLSRASRACGEYVCAPLSMISSLLYPICIYRHTRTHMLHTHTCCTHAHTQARMHACTHARTHACTHAHTHARTHAHMHACTHVHTHTYTLTHTCSVHTNTHTHTNTHMQCSKKLFWEGAWHAIVSSPDPQYGTHMRERRVCVPYQGSGDETRHISAPAARPG